MSTEVTDTAPVHLPSHATSWVLQQSLTVTLRNTAGEFADDHFDGNGAWHASDGEAYEGEWKEDKRHGYGEARWPSGDTYKGVPSPPPLLDGVGDSARWRLMCVAGAGEWDKGQVQGVGNWRWANGNEYQVCGCHRTALLIGRSELRSHL